MICNYLKQFSLVVQALYSGTVYCARVLVHVYVQIRLHLVIAYVLAVSLQCTVCCTALCCWY